MANHVLYRGAIEALYAATASGDWAAAESRLTDDFVVTEADGLPMAGRYTGKGGLRALYEKVFATVDVVGLDLQDICTGTSHAVAILDMLLAGAPPLRAPIAEMFEFRGEQICQIRPYYFDPAPVHAALKRSQA